MKNHMKLDPTRTTLLRRKFMVDMRKRFRTLSQAIRKLIIEDDAFGLKPDQHLVFHVEKQVWRFQTDPQKIASFKEWLKEQVNAGILEVDDAITGKPWTGTYVSSAYQKGMLRAYVDTLPVLATPLDFYQGSQAQFLLSSFNQPVAISKVQMLFTRAYDELEGITSDMSVKMGRILSDGLMRGDGVFDIARDLIDSLDMPINRAEMIARTEIIRAHAEGQLDSFEMLGVEEVGIMAEWSTAGDDAVCEECSSLEGVVMTVEEAHGMIPRHPNCRCTFIPALQDKIVAGQIRAKEEVKSAISSSLEAGSNPDWVGSDMIEE